MKVGIIGDSHDDMASVQKAVEAFTSKEVECVFHAGDIASPATARMFAAMGDSEFTAVFGNSDFERSMLAEVIEDFGGRIYEQAYSGECGGRKIFLTHNPSTIDEIIENGEHDLIIHGHTHRADMYRRADTLVINPGTAGRARAGHATAVGLDLDDRAAEEIILF